MEAVDMHTIIDTVQKKWMQQERCQKFRMEQLIHNKRGEAVALRYGKAHDQLQLGYLRQERLILKSKLVAAEGKAAELLFSCNLLRAHLELEKECSGRAADREAAREVAQRRAVSSEKQTAEQNVIESSERAESLAKKLEATIQQNLELCRKVDQLTSSQVKHKSGGRTPTADPGLVKIVPEAEAAEEEYARRMMEKDQLLAQAVEEAEILRERLGLMEAEGPVSQVVQDVVMQETESQNEDLKLQVDNLRLSEEKLLAEARHRDFVLEDKIRDLRLVSQERDRLQTSMRGNKLESKISGPQAAQILSESRISELETEAAKEHKLRQQLEDQLLDAKIELQRSMREKAEADGIHDLQEQRLKSSEETIKQLQDEKARLRNLCEDLDKTVRKLSAPKQSAENVCAQSGGSGPLAEPTQEEITRNLEMPAGTRAEPITSSDPREHDDYGRHQSSQEQIAEQIAELGAVLGAETVEEAQEAQEDETPQEEYSQFLNMSLVTPDSTQHDTQPAAAAALDSSDVEAENRTQKPQVAAERGDRGGTMPSSGSQMDTGSDSQIPQIPQGVASSRAAKCGVEETHLESASVANGEEGKHAEAEAEAVGLESESGAKGSTGRGSELPWESAAPSRADEYIVPVYTRRAASRQQKEQKEQKEEQRVEEAGAVEGSQEPGSQYEFNVMEQMEGLPREEERGRVKKKEGSRAGRKRKGDAKAEGKENEEEVPLPKPKPKRRAKAKQTEVEVVAVEVAVGADGQVAVTAEAGSKRQPSSRTPLVAQDLNPQQAIPPPNRKPPPGPAASAASANLPKGRGAVRGNAIAHLPPLPSQSVPTEDGNPKKRRLTRITPLPPSPLGQSAAGGGSGWGGGERGSSFGRPASQSSVSISMFTNAFKKERRESLAHSNSGVKKFAFSPSLM